MRALKDKVQPGAATLKNSRTPSTKRTKATGKKAEFYAGSPWRCHALSRGASCSPASAASMGATKPSYSCNQFGLKRPLQDSLKGARLNRAIDSS